MSGRVASYLQSRAEGEWWKIWYNTDANFEDYLWNENEMLIIYNHNINPLVAWELKLQGSQLKEKIFYMFRSGIQTNKQRHTQK